MSARVEAMARRAAQDAAVRLAERAPAGVRASVEDGRVVLEGKRLAARMFADPELRWPAEWLK